MKDIISIIFGSIWSRIGWFMDALGILLYVKPDWTENLSFSELMQQYLPLWIGIGSIILVLSIAYEASKKIKANSKTDTNNDVAVVKIESKGQSGGRNIASQNYYEMGDSKKKDNYDAPSNRNLAYQMSNKLAKYQRVMEEVSNYSVQNGMLEKFQEANKKFYEIRDMFYGGGESLFENSEDIKSSFINLNFAHSKYAAGAEKYIDISEHRSFKEIKTLDELESSPKFIEKKDLNESLRTGDLFNGVNKQIEELRRLLRESLQS